jgi:hypothetical protein
MKVFDVLLNTSWDLAVRGGDFDFGESTEQHQALILKLDKGELRQSGAVGVGISSMLLEDAPAVAVAGSIQEQMELDGQEVTRLAIGNDGALNLQGYYKDLPNG